jgi:hypothetical protein
VLFIGQTFCGVVQLFFDNFLAAVTPKKIVPIFDLRGSSRVLVLCFSLPIVKGAPRTNNLVKFAVELIYFLLKTVGL